MDMKIIYGVLLLIIGVCSTIVSIVNYRKQKGYVLTSVIAIIGYVLGIIEIVAGVL